MATRRDSLCSRMAVTTRSLPIPSRVARLIQLQAPAGTAQLAPVFKGLLRVVCAASIALRAQIKRAVTPRGQTQRKAAPTARRGALVAAPGGLGKTYFSSEFKHLTKAYWPLAPKLPRRWRIDAASVEPCKSLFETCLKELL